MSPGMGIFDRLSARIPAEDRQGITVLDLADLPEPERRILLSLLRLNASQGATSDTLREHLNDGTTADDLTPRLERLVRDGWLLRVAEGQEARYRVNLRHKQKPLSGLWSSLYDRLDR